MRLFLGVDGGQSGTTTVIGDESGRILGVGEAGPCNHAAAAEGRAKLERAVEGSLTAAAAQAGLDDSALHFAAACLGMSGGPEDKREILATLVRAERLIVTHDAGIALSGATASGQGVITIAGTGSIAFGRSAVGTARAGGWGYVFGDEGGAFDIVRRALRAALRYEEGWGPQTQLRNSLIEATGAGDANEVLHRFYGAEWPRSRVATLAPLVGQAAMEGDAVAADVLNAAAQELATLAMSVRSRLWPQGGAADVAYVGGVFQNEILLHRFRTLVELDEGVRCVAPRYGPAEGALLEAYRAEGLNPELSYSP